MSSLASLCRALEGAQQSQPSPAEPGPGAQGAGLTEAVRELTEASWVPAKDIECHTQGLNLREVWNNTHLPDHGVQAAGVSPPSKHTPAPCSVQGPVPALRKRLAQDSVAARCGSSSAAASSAEVAGRQAGSGLAGAARSPGEEQID